VLLTAEVGERLLLCSDGLRSEVEAADIAKIVMGSGTPQETADALVAQAISAGAFQADAGLPVTSQVDAARWAALQEQSC
jgi:peptidoglycan hydrolase-like protein with peptidoglycan-binding domain